MIVSSSVSFIVAQQMTTQPGVTIDPLPPAPESAVPYYTPTFGDAPGAFATIVPKIDGAISSGYTFDGIPRYAEWADAVKVDFPLDLAREDEIRETHNATLYVKNDNTNLYLAVVVRDEDFDKNDVLHVSFDNANNKEVSQGDDLLVQFGASNIYGDLHYSTSGETEWDSSQDGVGYAQWYHPFTEEEPVYTLNAVSFASMEQILPTASKAAAQAQTQPPISVPSNLQPPLQSQHRLTPITEVRYPEFQGTWIFEFAHPLRSGNYGQDFHLRYGDVVGLNIAYWDLDDDSGAVLAGGFPAFYQWEEMFEYEIAALSLETVEPDLFVDVLLVTQGIQADDNSLPLARGKLTAVQLYFNIRPLSQSVNLTIFLYGKDADTHSILPGPLTWTSTLTPSYDRDLIRHSRHFLLPTSWVNRSNLDLLIYFYSDDPESNYENNWVTQKVSFHELRVLNVYDLPVNVEVDGTTLMVSEEFMTSQEEAMRLMYPMEINFIRLDWSILGPPFSGYEDDDKDIIFPKLNEIALQITLAWLFEYAATGEEPNFPLPDLVYAFYPFGGGGSNPVYSGGLGIAGVGCSGTSGELTLAHESNHNLDRNTFGTWGRHTGPDNVTNCGAAKPDPLWPYENPHVNVYGLYIAEWPPKLIKPNYPDLMSYCYFRGPPSKWISPYRWNHLFAEFAETYDFPTTSGAQQAAKNAAAFNLKEIEYQNLQLVSNQALQISGWIDQKSNGAIDSILQVETPGIKQLREHVQQFPWLKELVGDIIQPIDRSFKLQKGLLPYELVAIGPADNELYSLSFFVDFISVEGPERKRVYFMKSLPFDERLKKGGRIKLRIGGKTIATQQISQHVPTIQLLTPEGGDLWKKGKMEIKWSAKDLDRDPLTFTVQYSPNGGGFWIPLGTGLTETSLTIDPSKIPGSTKAGAFIRVLASDGFNTGEGRNNEPFHVMGKPPKVSIDSPFAFQTFGASDLIPLKGHTFDLEDGKLPNSAFSWNFDGGQIGNGSAITAVRLGSGTHTIRLVVTDKDGMKGTASITIHVDDERMVPAFLKESTLRAGAGLSLTTAVNPTQVNPGDTAVLQVEITNGGIAVAEAIKLTVGIPPGLQLGSPSNTFTWKVLKPGDSVKIEVKFVSKNQGVFSIPLDLQSATYRPTSTIIHFSVGTKLPIFLKPVETKLPVISTLSVETKPPTISTTSDMSKTPETLVTINMTKSTEISMTSIRPSETSTQPQIPGFGVFSLFTAIPALLWFRRRRNKT